MDGESPRASRSRQRQGHIRCAKATFNHVRLCLREIRPGGDDGPAGSLKTHKTAVVFEARHHACVRLADGRDRQARSFQIFDAGLETKEVLSVALDAVG